MVVVYVCSLMQIFFPQLLYNLFTSFVNNILCTVAMLRVCTWVLLVIKAVEFSCAFSISALL